MKKIVFLFLFNLTIISHCSFDQDAKEVVRKTDEKAKGNDLVLIYITAPAKEKGVVFLKRYKEIWNWVPSIERNIKMPPSMMSQSWMGTDLPMMTL